MNNYIVITTTPDGLVQKFEQTAPNERMASLLAKSKHHPGQAVRAQVVEVGAA